MNNYRSFDQLRTRELTVMRHHWFDAQFELSDGQFSYGTISYTAIGRRNGIIETTAGTWAFHKPFFGRVTTITTSNGEVAGKIDEQFFARASRLILANGFEASLRRTGIFPTEFTWENPVHPDILRLVQKPFSFKKPITVTLNPAVKITETPLLIFAGIYLILLRQRRKAAAH